MINYIDNSLILKIIAYNNYLKKDSLFNLLNVNNELHKLKKYLVKKIILRNSDCIKFSNNKNFKKRY